MATTKVRGQLVDLNATGADKGLKMPSGTELNRPTNATGQIRNNTNETSNGSASQMEYYNGTDWKAITVVAIPAMSYLVIAGGGSGGALYGGGGGSGGDNSTGFGDGYQGVITVTVYY